MNADSPEEHAEHPGALWIQRWWWILLAAAMFFLVAGDYLGNVSRDRTEEIKVILTFLAMTLVAIWPSARPRLDLGSALGIGIFGLFCSIQYTALPLYYPLGVLIGLLCVPSLARVYPKIQSFFEVSIGGAMVGNARGIVTSLARRPPQFASIALVLLTTLSVANYARWGPKSTFEKVDTYDVAHYYLNAKYFDELGYLDLYPAMILADHDNGGPHFQEGNQYLAQDGGVHKMQPIRHALARGRVVRSNLFTPDRWAQFEHDSLYLQRAIPHFNDKLWRQMIQDHGFNGTPVWTMLARPLASAIPVESIKLLCHLDTLLLGIAFLVVGWGYGRNTSLWALLLFTTCYSLRWPTVSWAFLRYDWIAALMVAMVMLKKGWPFVGGLFAGYSATLRFFPAFWMWGPFMKGIAGLLKKKVHRSLLLLAAGFVVAVGVLEVGAVAQFGTESVETHFENMLDHNSASQLSSRRIGLALALAYKGPLETDPPRFLSKRRKALVKEQKNLRYGLAFLVMVVMGFGLRHTDDDEAFGWGFVPIFLLTTMSYYYYISRVTLGIVHAADLGKLRNKVGLGMLFGIEMFSNFSEQAYRGHRVFLIGNLAWLLSAYVLVMMVWLLWEAAQVERTTDGSRHWG